MASHVGLGWRTTSAGAIPAQWRVPLGCRPARGQGCRHAPGLLAQHVMKLGMQAHWGDRGAARRLHGVQHLPATDKESREVVPSPSLSQPSASQPSLDQQLHDAGQEGSIAPDSLQTPAAVWLPFKDGLASHDLGGKNDKQRRNNLSGGWNWLISWANHLLRLLSSWLLYQVQHRIMLGALRAKVAGYFLLGAPFVVAGSLMYRQVSGKAMSSSLVQAFGNLYHFPGPIVLNDVNMAATTVNVVLYFMGTLTFALILGVITEDLNKRYDRIRQGSYPVAARDHTLILGWSSQLVPLLRQVEVAQSERGAFPGTVVVLADRAKPEMDADLAAALPWSGLDLATRSGAPSSTVAIDRAGGGRAATVVVLRADTPGPAAAERQVAACLALAAVRAGSESRGGVLGAFRHSRPQTVVLQTPAAAGGGSRAAAIHSLAALMAGHGGAAGTAARQGLQLDDLDLVGGVSALLARSAVQPGCASVLASLLQQTRGGAWVSLVEAEGDTYAAARRQYPGATALGVLGPGPRATLNPADSLALGARTTLVMLAHGHGPARGAAPERTAGTPAHEPPATKPTARGAARRTLRPRRIVVLEWGPAAAQEDGPGLGQQLEALVLQLQLLAPDGSIITVLGPCPPPGLAQGEKEGEGGKGAEAKPTPTQQVQGRQGTRSGRLGPAAEVRDPGTRQDGRTGEGKRGGITLRHVPCDTSSADVLVEFGVVEADSVIVLGRSRPSGAEHAIQSDAELISALVLLEACLAKRRRLQRAPLHVLGTLRRPDTVRVVNHVLADLCRGQLTAELLQPDEIAAGVLTQIGSDPRIHPVLATLIGGSGSGAEVFLRPPGWLGISTREPVRYSHVMELARRNDETAIGLITRAGELILAPSAVEEREYHADDRVVVLA